MQRILLLFVFLFPAAFLSACQSQAVATAVPSPTPEIATPSPIPTPNPEQSRQAIIDGLIAVSVKANRMEVTTKQSDGSSVQTVIEFLPPDRKHISSQGSEYIVTGGKVYMKIGEQGEWKLAQMPVSTFLSDPPTADTIAQTISDERVLRKDQINGKEVWVYAFTSTTRQGDLTLVSKAELWIGMADELPVKYITDGDAYSVETDSTGASKPVTKKVVNTTLIDFNASFQIEPPIK